MFCKSCGYELVGIASGRCPECAREFDPADAATFDARPRRTKLRRWRRRLIIVGGLLVLLVVLFPRRYAQCRLTLRPPGSAPLELVRTQLGPPIWLAKLGVTYPGWTRQVAPTDQTQCEVYFRANAERITIRGTQLLGSSTASANGGYGSIAINGVIATPENAAAVFKTIIPDMFADRSFGVSIGSRNPPQP